MSIVNEKGIWLWLAQWQLARPCQANMTSALLRMLERVRCAQCAVTQTIDSIITRGLWLAGRPIRARLEEPIPVSKAAGAVKPMVMVEVEKETRVIARIPKEEALTRMVRCVRRVEVPITLRPIADLRRRNAPTVRNLVTLPRSAA